MSPIKNFLKYSLTCSVLGLNYFSFHTVHVCKSIVGGGDAFKLYFKGVVMIFTVLRIQIPIYRFTDDFRVGIRFNPLNVRLDYNIISMYLNFPPTSFYYFKNCSYRYIYYGNGRHWMVRIEQDLMACCGLKTPLSEHCRLKIWVHTTFLCTRVTKTGDTSRILPSINLPCEIVVVIES